MKFKRINPIYVIIIWLILLISATSMIKALMVTSTSISCTGLVMNQGTTGSWLHTSGTELYDSNNKLTRLYLAVIHDGQGFHLSQSDIQHIADMGFNGVRFFIYWGIAQPTVNSINTAYFSSGTGEPGNNAIDNIVNWARDAGLYVLLCPAWTGTWGPPSWALTSTGLTTADPDSASMHVDMLNDATIQQGIANLYTFLAQRYSSYPNVMFEGFNELESQSRPCSASERQQFADFNNMWISAIEANEGPTSHIKVLQLFYDWGDVNYVLNTPVLSGSHSNVVMAVHSYPLAKSPYTEIHRIGTEWTNFVHGMNYPIICTEGSNALGGNLTQWANEIVSLGFVGWGYFDFASPTDNQFYNLNYAPSLPAILDVLQPYMLYS